MKQSTVKEIIKKRSQAMADADLRQYHKDHHYYNGKLMTKKYQPREKAVDPEIEKDKDGLSCLNTLLYPAPTLGSVMGSVLSSLVVAGKSNKAASRLEKPSTDLLNRIKQCYENYCTRGLAPLVKNYGSAYHPRMLR